MARYELLMPKMGESVAEATVIRWVKEVGEMIEADEAVLEIATDKVDSEVPTPVAGKLLEQRFKENDVVQVGEVIAVLDTEESLEAGESVDVDEGGTPDETGQEGEAGQQSRAGEGTETGQETKSGQQGETVRQSEIREPGAEADGPAKGEALSGETSERPGGPYVSGDEPEHANERAIPGIELLETAPFSSGVPPRSESGRFYSPLVRSIAENEGIGTEELENIPGSGADGRLTKSDVLAYLEQKKQGGISASGQADRRSGITPPPVNVSPGDEIIEMDRMRRLIADHMVMSKQVSPHVSSFVEADVTNLVRWREKIKGAFEKQEGEKITYTPIFIEAVTKAIRDFPMINVSVKGTQIIKRKQINIGMATALPSGNLIVPVIRNADQMSLVGLTKAVNDLSSRARENNLQPDEVREGTFTVTNVGTFGNVMGTPIINQPQAAILALGAIRKKPAVLETPEGDVIAIRQMMFLSLSYDHRVIDGVLGGSFLRRIADYLEAFDPDRKI
ncbi:2-oxoglutarate dehydrogenase E2 component (dihydrolipoamide succinyltransferase) [Anseongella ginsenosidimutans]|uniref:Dihydrolipoamide acetyltransferase component of pyruvate dehydrogenase complex n=1 Tax=Anseongella ginsenosidimutans TaxID=496056 RepID=A0A4R3KQ50_9SPHI|nr:dihydrolipoamide acetyltransferase family protein [Anseongella ginsenosidimutans]QEC53684.1 2-oxo acid dehydrogenase subunit E2 [Anseongella ginsenosidimutans]TCS86066.1 2-oxoglutarate dehydrogenase E2 component (dihydrolipoamide succinyltransferase) [Anseongella ginsenosidimutans]